MMVEIYHYQNTKNVRPSVESKPFAKHFRNNREGAKSQLHFFLGSPQKAVMTDTLHCQDFKVLLTELIQVRLFVLFSSSFALGHQCSFHAVFLTSFHMVSLD